jgi:hypothetical protein
MIKKVVKTKQIKNQKENPKSKEKMLKMSQNIEE